VRGYVTSLIGEERGVLPKTSRFFIALYQSPHLHLVARVTTQPPRQIRDRTQINADSRRSNSNISVCRRSSASQRMRFNGSSEVG